MSTSPFDEQQIITLLTTYYNLLFSLCYITPEEIDFPPPSGREIDETLCHRLHLAPEVVSLMRHIPCPVSEGIMLEHELLVPQSHANSFVDGKLIEVGRDPEVGEDKWFLKGTDVALSVMGDQGRYLVLDTDKNTLRVCAWEPPNRPEDQDELGLRYDFHLDSPDDHYMRSAVYDPVEYLQSIIDKTCSLEWLPMQVHGRGAISTDGPLYSETKRILIEQYGWPDNFKSKEWKRDCKRIVHENVEHLRILDEERRDARIKESERTLNERTGLMNSCNLQ